MDPGADVVARRPRRAELPGAGSSYCGVGNREVVPHRQAHGDVHRGFDGGAADLAVAHRSVRVTDGEQGALDADGEVAASSRRCRCLMSMLPPHVRGGTIEWLAGLGRRDPDGARERSERKRDVVARTRTRPLDASTSEIRSHGSVNSSASRPKPGMIAVQPQRAGRSSRISTASTSPGLSALHEHRTGHRVDAVEVQRRDVCWRRVRGQLATGASAVSSSIVSPDSISSTGAIELSHTNEAESERILCSEWSCSWAHLRCGGHPTTRLGWLWTVEQSGVEPEAGAADPSTNLAAGARARLPRLPAARTGSNVYNASLVAALVRLGHRGRSALPGPSRGRVRLRGRGRRLGRRRAGGARVRHTGATVYRPDIGGLLPVYVADTLRGHRGPPVSGTER